MSLGDDIRADSPQDAPPVAPVDSNISVGDSIRADSIEKPVAATAPAPSQSPAPWYADFPGAPILAGAGKSFGDSVLGMQQLLGKGLQWVGSNGQFSAPYEIGKWLDKDAAQGARGLESEFSPYEKAHPWQGIGGEAVGTIGNPVNWYLPGVGGRGALGYLKTAAGAGGASAMETPVTDENAPFLYEKAAQATGGAVGGAVGRAGASLLGAAAEKSFDFGRGLFAKTGDAAAAASKAVDQAALSLNLNPAALDPDVRSAIETQLSRAYKSGASLDTDAVARVLRAKEFGIDLTEGQASRDPILYAREKDAAITKAGPLTDRASDTNGAMIKAIDDMGGGNAPGLVSGSRRVLSSLKGSYDQMQSRVSAAYQAFRDSTGKNLDVNLTGMAQDYARIKGDFDDVIPSAISKRFESYGLLDGTQSKSMSIDDAEKLIKLINLHYDPSNKAQANGLNQLRESVQSAIVNSTGENEVGQQAAALGQTARQMAARRFALEDQVPMLRELNKGVDYGNIDKDKLFEKYLLNGDSEKIGNTMKFLDATDPDSANYARRTAMGWLRDRVVNKAAEDNGNGTFSPAQLKNIVNDDYNSARLGAVIGDGNLAKLQRLQRVAEDVYSAPAPDGVNYSKTAPAIARQQLHDDINNAPSRYALIGAHLPAPLDIPFKKAVNDAVAQRTEEIAQQATHPSMSSKTKLSDLLDHLPGISQRAAIFGSSEAVPELLRQRSR